MKRFLFLLVLALCGTSVIAQKAREYPIAPKDSVVNTYFDFKIADPYQWMENPSDPRLTAWLEEQDKLTRKQGHKQVYKATLYRQIASMYNYVMEEDREDYVEKKREEIKKYYFKVEVSDNWKTPDLLYKKKGETNYKYLVKAKEFRSHKGDNVGIENYLMNDNQDIVAVLLSHSGSDWREVYFYNLLNGQRYPDTLKYLRVASNYLWIGNDFYYDRFKKPKQGREHLDKAYGQAMFFHQIGTSQQGDKLIYQNPDTTGSNNFSFFLRDSSKLFFNYLIKSRGKFYKALANLVINPDKSGFLKNFLIYPALDSSRFDVPFLNGDTAFIRTTWGAPNGRVLKANINDYNKFVEFIPEYDSPLREINPLGKDKIACIYKKEATYKAVIYSRGGKILKFIDFPDGKKVNDFYEYDSEAEYTDFYVSSFYHPDLWYQLSLKDLTFKPSQEISVPYDPKSLETRYVEYKSKDGTMVPMYISCLKTTKLDGNNPTLLWGYGGYGTSIEPEFDRVNALWLLHGGILAIPDVRGGGVKGSEWQKNGSRLKKQNTIDDFIGAAEYLINEKYTNPNKLAVKGGSHGGMLIGALITQRPDICKVAIAEAGNYDMIRFENFTIGSVSANINEFGTVTNYDDFINLKSYSPYYNVKKDVNYPNVLLLTGDNDDRVPPFHSYKFLAKLQDMGSPKSLYMIYVTKGSGHSGALTVDSYVDKLLFEYYFLFDQLDVSLR